MSAVAWWQKRLHPAPPISHSPGSAAFNFAGKGTIKAIAARTREKRYYEGTELVVSNIGFSKGLQKFEDISGKTVAIDALGSISHYQGADRSRQESRHGSCHGEADADTG